MPNYDMFKCPKCGHANTADFWDENTKKVAGIPEDDRTYKSISAPTEEHREFETYYHCPMCNREVAGIEMVKPEKQ